jgi:hypothetical protein
MLRDPASITREVQAISQAQGNLLTSDRKQLIERIILGPNLSDSERDAISELVGKAGLGDRLAESSLLGQVRYT